MVHQSCVLCCINKFCPPTQPTSGVVVTFQPAPYMMREQDGQTLTLYSADGVELFW